MAAYGRIAGEIRQRIERGELRPGDRVPSTREITARWRVAMATASRVLAALRDEGLVRAVPGVGTVVAERAVDPGGADPTGAPDPGGGPDPRGPDPSADGRVHPDRPEPTADRLVRVAVEIADREGLAGLSMRRVAARLGVATMSLYRHVPGKEDLVLRMIDSVLAARPLPDVAGGWRERLEAAARLQWDLFRAHPWLAGALSMTRPQLLPGAIAHTEWMLRALDGHGLTAEEMLHAAVTVFGFVRGTAVNLETEAEQRQHTGLTPDEWLAGQSAVLTAITGSGRFPLFTRTTGTEVDMALGTLFEFGLARLLDGIGEWISDRPALDGQRTT
ncbi:TetR family transcriptional regulator [Saccharothrix australiensis]|uniref:TetR family transcriptional regulator n=2 Tax=Saccharothrix australiensis TaxID=2072 RepID=A0A495W9M0_9PSEU|nr:TetR family transcriptional regulator [Saccharothrix australiensis]